MHWESSTYRLLAMAALLLCVVGAVSAQVPPPPGSELLARTQAEVETDPSPTFPRGPGLQFEEAPEGIGVAVDLADVPTLEELGLAALDPFAQPRSHIQGKLLQHQEALETEEPIDLVTSEAIRPPESPSPSLDEIPAAPGDTVTEFDGQSYTGWIPPDTIHAAGPGHVVMAVNSGFTVYSKLGTVLRSYTTFDSFLHKPSGWSGFMFDPRILFDAQTNRFVMLILGRDDTNMRSYVWTASTADPTGTWWLVRFNVTRNQDTANEAWLDYAGLGVDDHGLYWTGNYFKWSGGFDTATIRTNHPNLVDGTGGGGGYGYTGLSWPSGGSSFAVQPTYPHNDNLDNEMFFVNTYSGAGSKILLWRFSGDRYAGQGMPTGPTLTRNEIPLPHTYYAIGMNVDQGGSATDIDGLDARVMNAVYQNRRVYATWTDDVSDATTESGTYTVKLNTNLNTLVADHLLWGTGRYRFFPAVTVNAEGISQDPEVAVYYSYTRPSSSGDDQYVSAVRKIYTTFPTTGPDTFFQMGEGPYVRLDSDNINRWGDYSGAAYDWTCRAATGSIEYAGSGNIWRTRIRTDEIGNGKCPQIEVTDPNGGEVWNAGTTHTITWLSADLTTTGHDIFLFYHDGIGYTQIAGPLSPGSTSFAWDIPGIRSTTGRIFVGNWDAGGSVYETSDWSDAHFRVTAPNLQVSAPGVGQATLLPGEGFTVSATVDNVADGSSNVSTTLRYFVSTNPTISTFDTQIGTDFVSVLGAGASSPESASVTAPAVTGAYWVGACVDQVDGETNASDQCSSGVPIIVRPHDTVTISSYTFSGASIHDACVSITIGPGVTFDGTADVTLVAPVVEIMNVVSWLTGAESAIYSTKPLGCP